MRTGRKLVVFLVVATALACCVHEIPMPGGTTPPVDTTKVPPLDTLGNCDPNHVYFVNEILPLVMGLCGKDGCHGTNPHEFSLLPYVNRYGQSITSYQTIVGRLGSAGNLSNSLSDMAEKNITGYVAPTSSQLAMINKWISEGAKNDSCTAGCDTTKYTYKDYIQKILVTHCTSCHGSTSPSAGINLSTPAGILAETTNNPGRLLGSIQWTAGYNSTATRMPQGATSKLPACQITQIKWWIANGALTNN